MKQSIWQLGLVFNFFRFFTFLVFICLPLGSNSEMPHFKQQQNNSTSAKVYRSDSFNKIYDNRNRLEQLQAAAELAKLIVIQKQLNSEVINPDLPADNKIHANTNSSSQPDPKNLQTYPDNYNPFAHGDLTETFYKLRAFLKSRYRETQEIKYPYLAKLRHEREQKENLQQAAREQAHKQAIAIALIRDYNRRLNNLPRQINSSLNQPGQASLSELYQAKISEQFCSAKFNNLEQQSLYTQQLDLVCELVDREIFPKNTVGLQDFSDTVLETVTLAHQANCQNLINITKSLTELAQNFLALGRGVVRSGGNLVKAGSNLILHPVKTGVNLWQLTKNLTVSLGRAVVTLASYDPDADIFSEQMEIESEYTQAKYNQFINFLEVTPRIEKFEKIGEVLGDQLLSIATTLVAGKAITLISDAALAAKLQQAIVVKNKVDKTKSAKISWLNKFGMAGQDVARTLGIVAAEEYELAELNGLVVSFKNSPANNQTLFNHADEYLKHNKSGKKAKRAPRAVKAESDEIKPARIIGHQKSLPELRLEAKELATKMGFKETKDFVFDSCTEKVYKKGNLYISLDRNGHKGGFWKVCDKKKRKYTYDKTLTKIIGT